MSIGSSSSTNHQPAIPLTLAACLHDRLCVSTALTHLMAWIGVGTGMGMLLSPQASLIPLVGFGIAGLVCCVPLGIVTYPFGYCHQFIWVGGVTGYVLAKMQGDSLPPMAAALFLLVGALIGGTSIVWILPLRGWIIPKLKTYLQRSI